MPVPDDRPTITRYSYADAVFSISTISRWTVQPANACRPPSTAAHHVHQRSSSQVFATERNKRHRGTGVPRRFTPREPSGLQEARPRSAVRISPPPGCPRHMLEDKERRFTARPRHGVTRNRAQPYARHQTLRAVTNATQAGSRLNTRCPNSRQRRHQAEETARPPSSVLR